MKYETFDLFDTIEEHKIKLTPVKGINTAIITELTMEKVGRPRSSYKFTGYAFRKVAILIVGLIALIGTLLVTSAAFRKYLEDPDGFWLISSDGQSYAEPSGATELDELMDISDPLGRMLPEEFELVVHDGDSLENLIVIYESPDGEVVFLSITNDSGSMQIDYEGAEISEIIRILDQEVILVIENADVRIAWIDQEISKTVVLIATGLPKEKVVTLAEQIMQAMS